VGVGGGGDRLEMRQIEPDPRWMSVEP